MFPYRALQAVNELIQDYRLRSSSLSISRSVELPSAGFYEYTSGQQFRILRMPALPAGSVEEETASVAPELRAIASKQDDQARAPEAYLLGTAVAPNKDNRRAGLAGFAEGVRWCQKRR